MRSNRRYSAVLSAAMLLLPLAAAAQVRDARPAPREGALVRTEKAFPTGDRASSVLLVERFAPAEVRRGQPFRYEIRVTNLSRSRLEEVVLSERFAPGFRLKGTAPTVGRMDGGSAVWVFATLEAGATQNIIVEGSTDRPEELVSCATVTFRTTVCSTTRIVEPNLAIMKTMPPDVLLCDDIPIRVVVANNGSGVARNVRVTDNLPPGLTTRDGKNAILFEAGDLAAGQSREFTLPLRAARTGSYTNTARATEEGGLSAEATAVTVVRQPALVVTKRGPELRYLGRQATFDITVENRGDAPARDTVLTDTLPPGVELVGAEEGGSASGGQVSWQLGTLAPGASRTVRLTIRPTAIGRLTNTAMVRAYCAEATASAPLEVRGIPAILLEAVDEPDPIEVGGQVTYNITVTNQGSATGTNIVIECTLPNEQDFVTATGPTQATAIGKSVRFASLATLSAKATATYRVTVRGNAVGDVRFRVSLKSDQIESPVEETESTHIY